MAKFFAKQGSIGIDYPRRRDALWRFCFLHLVPLFPNNTHHTVEQNLALLAPLGIEVVGANVRCRLEVADLDRRMLQSKLDFLHNSTVAANCCVAPVLASSSTSCTLRVCAPETPCTSLASASSARSLLKHHYLDRPYLVIHPAARWFFKCWEDDRFAEVIQYFAHQGWPIIVTASPEKEEIDLVNAILKNITVPQVISLAGQLTLGELAALIEGARLFLGVDSVPMHMAAALQKDTVALFGPSKIKEWHPWQTRYRLIDARDYGSVLDPDAVNTVTKERYLKNIPVAPVIAAVEEFLAS